MNTTAEDRYEALHRDYCALVASIDAKLGDTTAEDRYAELHAECLAMLGQITDAMEDRDAPSDRMNWGHVGDLRRVLDMLRQTAEVMGLPT
jgi:hypothetical protein